MTPYIRCFFLFTIFTVCLRGQDTISVYFRTGTKNLEGTESLKLNTIPSRFELKDLVSVEYVGYADSVGSSRSNKRLADKRAKTVEYYCRSFIPNGIPCTIKAAGELNTNAKETNRRVDMILHFRIAEPGESENAATADLADTARKCFEIDYFLLHRSNTRTITQRNKNFILIETTPDNFRKFDNHYYGSVDKNGKINVKKVKWQWKTTGVSWWTRSRYTVLMPEKDFRQFKIFQKVSLPCSDCAEDFFTNGKMTGEDTCLQVDRFLMRNIQVKVNPFKASNYVRIRAPREFVNTDYTYYIGCDKQLILNWETKRAKRKQKYYYASLPLISYRLENISRTMECCKSVPEPSECDKTFISCASLPGIDRSLILIGEIGNIYSFKKNRPYFSLGFRKYGLYSQFFLTAGITYDKKVFAQTCFQLNFCSFPFRTLAAFSSWQTPSNLKPVLQYGRLYAGTQFKYTGSNFCSQDFHLGFSLINSRYSALFQRFFIQSGLGFDYAGLPNTKLYPILQAGIDVKVLRFNFH